MTQKENRPNVRADAITAGKVCPEVRQRLLFLGKVLGCILIALLFLVAVFDPAFGRVLACLGVIVCCSLAAVIVDRRLRRGKYELSNLS